MGLNTKDNQKHYSYDFILGIFICLLSTTGSGKQMSTDGMIFFFKSCFNFLMSKFLVLAYLS